MKNKLATYFSVLAMVMLISSCAGSGDEDSFPYAYIKSFGIGNITSSYPAFTESGKDTLVVKTIAGESYPFTINQSTCEIYNNDSLPYATDLSKVVVNIGLEGVASIYEDGSDSYEYFSASDSLDFTSPRRLRITSLSGHYEKIYTVSINAHKVNPDLLEWKKINAPLGIVSEKAIEFNGSMLVFGKAIDGKLKVMSTDVADGISWSEEEITTLPSATDFSTMHLFNGTLYVVAGGDLYNSVNAVEWNAVFQGNSLLAIIGASDGDYLWVASADKLYRTADGAVFENYSDVPVGFPLYGVSTVSYPLLHNKNILCNILVGYATVAEDEAPKVWSKLSNYDSWEEYYNEDNPYPCPSLTGLTVLQYGDFLYALGGRGHVGNVAVEAFDSFYISRDDGIVWKAPEGFYQCLPKELKGCDLPFVATVDSENHIWIITSGEKGTAWRGVLNSLNFK